MGTAEPGPTPATTAPADVVSIRSWRARRDDTGALRRKVAAFRTALRVLENEFAEREAALLRARRARR